MPFDMFKTVTVLQLYRERYRYRYEYRYSALLKVRAFFIQGKHYLKIISMISLPAASNKSFSILSFLGSANFGFALTRMQAC